MQAKLIFSQADSLVSPTHKQESDSEKRTNAIFGRRCLEQYEKLNPRMSWAKTFLASLIGTGGWYSTRCKLIWKMKATKSKRFYFQLAAKTLPTEEKEFGLLPTPETSQGGPQKDVKISKDGSFYRENKKGVRFGVRVQDVVASGMLPTPTTSCANGGTSAPRKDGKTRESELNHWATINRDQFLPTPTTRDYKGSRSKEALENAGRSETNSLPDSFAQPGKTSQLNPRFVAEMMGFPPDWTELPFLNGETSQ